MPTYALDPTFGAGGTVAIDQFKLQIHAVAVQGDGKVVLAGEIDGSPDLGTAFSVARLTAAGTLDTTFGNNGFVITDFDPINEGGNTFGSATARGVAIQADGKIVVGGFFNVGGGGYSEVVLARYLPNGKLDSTFGLQGVEMAAINGNDITFQLLVQPDGKIVVAGGSTIRSSSAFDIFFARFTSTGSFDNTFGTNGVFNPAIEGVIDSMALDSAGRIVASGDTVPSYGDEDFTVFRLTSDGSLDTTFNHTGIVITQFPRSNPQSRIAVANGVAIQLDGKIVAAGQYINMSSTTEVGVARYNTDGTLDKSFHGSGTNYLLLPSDYAAQTVAVASNGQIAVAGNRMLVAVFNADGYEDTLFDPGLDNSLNNTFRQVVSLPDGGFVVAGDQYVARYADPTQPTFSMPLDLDANGSFDPLTDGILAFRYMFGFTGSALTSGALGANATRRDPAMVENFANEHRLDLDVDDNGVVDPLTDAVLIERYLFGFTGTSLTSGAIGRGAQRTDPAAITAYLDQLCGRTPIPAGEASTATIGAALTIWLPTPVEAVPGVPQTFEELSLRSAVSNTMHVTITVQNGTLSLGNSAGLAFDPGYHNGMTQLAFSGTPHQLNTVLPSLTYTANAGATNDVLCIVAVDLSNPLVPVVAPQLLVLIQP